MPAFALRLGIYGVIVPLAFVVVVPHSFDMFRWWLTPSPVPANPALFPQTAEHVPDLPPAQIALLPLPSVNKLLADADRLQDLFDQGRMHELYANFSDEAKAQVPEAVFVTQADEVLEQLGPRKPDGWNDADRLSTLLNGPSKGRQALLWKLHPDILKFDFGSQRFGSLADSSEDLVLDVSGGKVKLAMFSEFKEKSPGASIRLPQTCYHKWENPLQHCNVPAAPVTAHDALAIPSPVIARHAVAIPTPGHTWVSTALAIDPDGHAVIAAVGLEGWLLMASCRTTPCRGDAMTTTTHALALGGRVALAIGRDGLPMAAATSKGRVMLVHCDDRSCLKISSTVVASGQALGFALGLDGLPLITYSVFDEHTLATQLLLARCQDATCAQPAITIAVGALNRPGSSDTSIGMARDGRAMIAFEGPDRASRADASIQFARCADRLCSAVTVRELVIKGNSATSRVSMAGTEEGHGAGPGTEAVVLHAGAQGGPVMGYTMLKDGESLLRILICSDSDCAGGIATHTVHKVDDTSSIAAEIDPEDRLVFAAIAYRGVGVYPNALPPNVDPPPPDYDTWVALLHCATPACPPISDSIALGSIGIGRSGELGLARRKDGTLVTIAFDPHRPAILLWDAAPDR